MGRSLVWRLTSQASEAVKPPTSPTSVEMMLRWSVIKSWVSSVDGVRFRHVFVFGGKHGRWKSEIDTPNHTRFWKETHFIKTIIWGYFGYLTMLNFGGGRLIQMATCARKVLWLRVACCWYDFPRSPMFFFLKEWTLKICWRWLSFDIPTFREYLEFWSVEEPSSSWGCFWKYQTYPFLFLGDTKNKWCHHVMTTDL